jgi:hypothetical protein
MMDNGVLLVVFCKEAETEGQEISDDILVAEETTTDQYNDG